MKKLIFLIVFLISSLFSLDIKAQGPTVDNIIITDSIDCYSQTACIEININQTNPTTTHGVVIGYYLFGTWANFGTIWTVTNTSLPLCGYVAQNYTVLLVDSTQWVSNPNPTNTSAVYDQSTINITQPVPLSNTGSSTSLLCNGDCDAEINITISGGTPPYNVDFNGEGPITLGLNSTSILYDSLCEGTYSINVTDANNCSVHDPSTSVSSITITEPSELIPDGDVSSDYNGQDISCFGDTDGEITAAISGGTPPYTYSINGSPFSSNFVFSGLGAGTYTINYRDANGCDTSEQITLFNPPQLSGTVSINQQISCFGGCDGELEFQVDNILTGTPPYTYSIDGGVTFQNSPIFSGLCVGPYSIIVQDANQCFSQANKVLFQPTALTFTDSTSDYNGFNISCNGYSDGLIKFMSDTGGTPPYTYSIDGGSSFSNQTVYSNLTAGTYDLVLKDANDCETLITVVLTEPPLFEITYSIDSGITCPSSCDAGITAVPTNGVLPILYTLTSSISSSSQPFPTWAGLCEDNYVIDAVDANGCSTSTSVSLVAPLPFVYTLDSMMETCDLSNGTASITITQGGTPPYAYLWDDPSAQTTFTASGLATGLYEVRVTDANGCEFLEDVFVDEQDILLTFDSVPPCNGNPTGSATVNPVGTPPYTYLWETNESTSTINGLISGYYTVTVTDGNGCSATDSVEVPVSDTVTLTLDVLNSTLEVLCNGYPSDTVSVIASGGTGPNTYQYYIPGFNGGLPQYNYVFSGLYAGTYNIVAEDANGCSDTLPVTINEPDVIYFSVTSSDVSCNGGNDGSVWVDSVSGGTAPYDYSWDNGQNTGFVSGLSAGTYILTVTDVNACASNPLSATAIVSEPSELTSITVIHSHSSCSGTQTAANGEAEVIANGATSPYQYSWTGPNGFSSSLSTISLLLPGLYVVDIIDGNGCLLADTAEILPGTNPILDVTIQDVSCYGANDGLVTTSASSGTSPYSFSNDGGNFWYPLGHQFGPTGQAAYFITVRDDEGCTDSDSIFVNEPDELIISSMFVQNVLCYDSANGEITANVIGGTGDYSYLWNDGQITGTAVDLIPFGYYVTVTDSTGCSVVSSTVNITQPDSLYISSINVNDVTCYAGNDGSAQVIVNGGTSSYNYQFTGGSNVNLIAGTYGVIVVDQNGCVASSDFVITEPFEIDIQFVIDSVTCIGGSDGFANAIVNGGVPSYYLTWENGLTTNIANNLSAGYHSLSVIDDNGCLVIDSVEIFEPLYSIKIDSLIISEITCHDANNASITVLATGGELPYVYSNDNGANTQSNIGFSNLGSSQYIMYVRDNKGCIDRDTVDIINPDSIYIDTTIFSHVSCHGANDGEIHSIYVTGGYSPYLYSVNGGSNYSNTATFNGYSSGTYTVQVIDNNNCSAQDIIIIEEPDELDVTITLSNWNGYEIQCNGDNSGTASISINGGNGPYIKEVYDPSGIMVYSGNSNFISTANTLNGVGISAGTYLFVIIDNNGCQYQEHLTYQEPSQITHDFIIDHITCDGWSNGSITAVINGGVGSSTSYNYSWSPTMDTTYTINNLGIGNYTLTVIDDNGCVYTQDTLITDDYILSYNVGTTSNPTCWDYCNGEIEIIPTGGSPSLTPSGPVYNYQWDDDLQQTSQTAYGLCVDNINNVDSWTCVITDALGCVITTNPISLTQPEKVEVFASQIDNISCYGDSDASMQASSNGGTAPYTYLWNTGNPGSLLNNQPSGFYVVVATDVNGCMDTTDITIDEPDVLHAEILDVNVIDVACHEENTGEISVTVIGGTVNVSDQYTYVWNSMLGTPSSTYDFSNQTGTGTLSNLDTGVYYVEVTDINGCQVVSNMVYVSQPTNALHISVDSIDQTCITEGTAFAYVLGGTQDYTYLWTPGSETTSSITGLSPNVTYVVEVWDANGCYVTGSTRVNGYQNIFLPENNDYFDSVVCLGQSIYIEVEDKDGYTYLWSTGETSASITVEPQDPLTVYTLTVVDPTCPLDPFDLYATFSVNKLDINPIASPNPIVLGGEVTIESSYMYSNYIWSWDNADTAVGMSMTDKPETSTMYYIQVTDDYGCQGVDSIYVVVGTVPYDAISPNNDGWNDEWDILDIDRYPNADIQIFNRWGNLVFSSKGSVYSSDKWDGTNQQGNPLPVGTYYYTINLNDGSELQSGPVTIVR